MANKKSVQEKNIPLLFFLNVLMATVLIYSNKLSAENIVVHIISWDVSVTMFIYPFVFFIANYITRHFGSTQAIKVLLITLTCQILYFLYTNTLSMASIFSFSLAQGFNLVGFTYLEKKKSTTFLNRFSLYILVFLIDNIVFLSVSGSITDWSIFILVSTACKCILGAIFALIEQKSK